MRLIDADKVKQYVLTVGFYCDTDADKEATAEEIDQLFPTVEAIPINFLERLIFEAKQSKELIKEEYRYFTSIYGHKIERITYDQTISLIEGIIDYWKDKNREVKENEID